MYITGENRLHVQEILTLIDLPFFFFKYTFFRGQGTFHSGRNSALLREVDIRTTLEMRVNPENPFTSRGITVLL